MAAPELKLKDPQRYEADQSLDVPAGEQSVVVKLPVAVPVGKIARLKVDIRAQIIDAPEK